ncbi:MAG: transketolase [Syntrophomonadaceae bacterium]|nr:transketolase [Syntrophomonadaceae bacterium]
MREINQQVIEKIESKARRLRREVIRMVGIAGSGHPGGALSAADLVACLYFWEMRYDPKRPDWPDRDRFVLSKGHAAPLLYAVLAESGFFPPEMLGTLRRLGSPLQGHPDMRKLPGVEASTGSLGQGIGWAVGMALAARLDGRDSRVYVLLGDGELEEGMVWEAVMAASHYRLGNLVALIDNNGLQIDGPLSDVMSVEPIGDKFRAFGWETREIDGHEIGAILHTLNEARQVKDRPFAVIARTVKGKGCSFMEGQVDWHGKAPTPEELERALREFDSV